MGSVLHAAKINFPFGEPPCVEDPHNHASIPPPDPVPNVPDLQAKITLANNNVEEAFQGLIKTRYAIKEQFRRSEEDWANYGKKLEQDCNVVRNSLVDLAEHTQECDDVQQHALPDMFKKRATHKHDGSIEGCADWRNQESFEKKDCECAAGTEAEGCIDSPMISDHALVCSHLRKRILPQKALWRLTSKGGACSVDSHTPFNMGILPTAQPPDFKMPAQSEMPAPLLAFPQPPHSQQIEERRLTQNQREVERRIREFL